MVFDTWTERDVGMPFRMPRSFSAAGQSLRIIPAPDKGTTVTVRAFPYARPGKQIPIPKRCSADII